MDVSGLVNAGPNLLKLLNDPFGIKPGAVLKARVVEVLQDSVILNLRGKLISAKTRINFKKGQQIELVYRGISKEGAVEFRLTKNKSKPPVIERDISEIRIKQDIQKPLLVLSNKKNASSSDFIFLQVPVVFNGEYHTANIKIQKRPYRKNKSVDSHRLRIEFSITTKNLNTVYITAEIFNKQINGEIQVTNIETKYIIEKKLDLLEKRLKELDYKMVDFKIRVNREIRGFGEMILFDIKV
ncbi:MAG: hypothetical protein PWQ82_530 [Thermosediminibacterales bacterium]|nr:hypothetical protein [Thermosediminibacterales bacterium]